jgi:hypothetical protein
MLSADEVARGTNGMGVDRTGKGQAAGVVSGKGRSHGWDEAARDRG